LKRMQHGCISASVALPFVIFLRHGFQDVANALVYQSPQES
jgi:hypothetical protein